MTSKSKQTLLCVVSAVLALALVFSLIRLHNYKNSAKELYSRMQIENLLLEYKPTILFVEHDSAFCENIATKTVEL